MTPDDRLATLLSDAVSDVEPTDRLGEIRDRTRVVPLHSRRPWLFGVGGAVVATAAVVTAIALASGPTPDRADGGPASSSGPTPSGTSSPTAPSTPLPSGPAGGTKAFAVYYVGDGPRGPVLFREFHPGADTTPTPQLALADLSSLPQDPDYRTPWHAGDFVGSSLTNGVIRVTLGSASLHDRPAGMSASDAGAAVQQVVYTMQAAYGTRAPVQFVLGQNPIDQVLGVPTSEPIVEGKPLSTLSLMSITTPTEDAKVRGSLKVDGVASSFEATVHWELLLGGAHVVKQGIFTASGYAYHLYPFRGTIDLSGIVPGQYVLRLSTDDPSGGAGYAPDVDTRLIQVK
jgi:hypothetical protein